MWADIVGLALAARVLCLALTPIRVAYHMRNVRECEGNCGKCCEGTGTSFAPSPSVLVSRCVSVLIFLNKYQHAHFYILHAIGHSKQGISSLSK